MLEPVPLRVAAGLAPQPVPQQPEESDSDEDDSGDHDPDYDQLDQTEDVEDCHHGSYTLRSDVPPEDERQFLVSEPCLASILGKCDLCEEPCEPVVQFTRGTMIGTFPPAQMDIPPSGRARNVTMECAGPTFSWLVA